MKSISPQWMSRVWESLQIPGPDPEQTARRIEVLERDIILPVKAAAIGILYWSFYFSFTPWIGEVGDAVAIAVEFTQVLLLLYLAINLVGALLLLATRRLPLAVSQWTVFTISLIDSIFLTALVMVTGGYDSILFWLFVGLIIRNAVSFPLSTSQLSLNVVTIACYVLGGMVEINVAENLPDDTKTALGLDTPAYDSPAEPIFIRVVLLLLMTACCYGLQILLEKQRQAAEEAREFALREGQLQSAGRLAVEFAHQIKNPLAIITNAVFSLQRAVREGRNDASRQLEIIQEEVARSDQIVTQIMGYAQLTEGRVEKLSVIEELERAIDLVFPPAVAFGITITRRYGAHFPPLMMQRGHLAEIFLNLLKNAREAADGSGHIQITAECRPDYTIRVTIADDGPGIPPEKLSRIFEAYYTTKEKGTGLGLAIVRHNVELYGGAVHAESELGKGARFILEFPARTPIRLARTTL
jgi:two-component system, NtrC family, sensor histidine kinase HydH